MTKRFLQGLAVAAAILPLAGCLSLSIGDNSSSSRRAHCTRCDAELNDQLCPKCQQLLWSDKCPDCAKLGPGHMCPSCQEKAAK